MGFPNLGVFQGLVGVQAEGGVLCGLGGAEGLEGGVCGGGFGGAERSLRGGFCGGAGFAPGFPCGSVAAKTAVFSVVVMGSAPFARRFFPPAAAGAGGDLRLSPARDPLIAPPRRKSKITNTVVFASFAIRRHAALAARTRERAW
jgi:hypothetical protein